MRVRLRDDLHALGRPGAIPAVVAAVGGVLALRAPTTGAWALVATVDALGTSDQVTVDTLSARAVSPVAVAAWGVGVVVIVVAVLVALDRPPPAAVPLLLGGAAGMVAVMLTVLLARPAPEDFVSALQAGPGEVVLPMDVSFTVGVEPAAGPMLLAIGALLVIAGTLFTARQG